MWIGACLALGGAGTALAQHTGALPSPTAQAASAKGANDAAIADCMQLWDKGTHMSKQEWARTCQRIQSRLENLKIDNLKGTGTDAPAKPRTGAKGGSSASN
jgi:hypothetical protein